MDIATEIEAVVNRLSYRWYEKKRKEFVDTKKGYDPETNTRNKKVAGYNTVIDDETGETYSEIAWEDTEITTIEEFCWFDEERYSTHRDLCTNDMLIPEDASTLITELCMELNDYIPKEDVIASYNIVNKSEIILREKMDALLSINTDKRYENVCRSISEKATMLFRNIFAEVVGKYTYGSDSPNKLDFELNKQQLAALIFLMIRAGFLVDKKRNVMGKYDFFEKHFCWTDSSKDTQHELTDLRRLMSDFKKGDYGNAVEEVMKRLKRAYEK